MNGRQRLRAHERREEIVQVAIELVGRQGIAEVTTKDMGEAVGITQGAVFRHFASKDTIWLAVLKSVREQWLSVLDEAAGEGDEPLEALERMFFALIAFAEKHPAIPRLLFSDLLARRNMRLRRSIQDGLAAYEEKIAALLRRAKSRGALRAGVNEKQAAAAFVALVQGLVMRGGVHKGRRLVAEAETVFPLFVEGIRSAQAGRRARVKAAPRRGAAA